MVISSCENFYEGFLADNYQFLDSTELFHWCYVCLEEKIDLDDFIRVPTVEEVTDRLLSKIIEVHPGDEEMIETYVLHLKKSERVKLYYVNNMIQFMEDHKEIRDLFLIIMSTVQNLSYAKSPDDVPDPDMDVKKWNKHVDHEYFMDPNDPPECIKSDLELFRHYIMKYVYVKYLSFDRIYRLRNFKRRVVTVIDTDSNILSMDILVNWILDNVIQNESFGRDKEKNIFVIINTITFVISSAIQETLLDYGKHSNIPKEYRPRYSMKNEFFFSLLIIGKTKKRYISKVLLREGNLMNPPKNDIKGFDFKKATTSEQAEQRFMSIIKEYIIAPEYIDTRKILREIYKFEEEIKESIIRGERTFLPNGNAKELAGYKDPYSEQSIRGVLAWNILNPDNQIELPAKVSLVKMTIFTIDDMAPLKETHPEIYQTILDKIFYDTTGAFVNRKVIDDTAKVIKQKKNAKPDDWRKEIPKKLRPKFKDKTLEEWNDYVRNMSEEELLEYTGSHDEVKSKGLQVLAIPSNGRIPEWAIPYLDMHTMINNIIAPFRPVLELFNNKTISEGKSHAGINRKSERISNIVKF